MLILDFLHLVLFAKAESTTFNHSGVLYSNIYSKDLK